MNYKILIVDDEIYILDMLSDLFTRNGYSALTASNSQEALSQIEKNPDLILLDVNMPETDGFTLCRDIRNMISCPILFVTARVDESDKLTGLALGGDDYIEKPFSTAELLARVKAHLRREERQQSKSHLKYSSGLLFDYNQRLVSYKGTTIPLLRKEYDILEFLSLHPGQIFDKERIYESIWGYEGEGNSSVVTEHIRRARGKFETAGCSDPIETVWGVGYKWK